MKKIFTLTALFIFIGHLAQAQQDPMFTKYMFNSLVYNPAYAGAYEHMYVGLLHRTQWYEVDGAPSTQSFTLHSPLKNERVGVGFSMVNDKIGPTNSTGANLSYAYKIPIGNMRLSIGMQGGVLNYRANWAMVNVENPDPAFEGSENRWLPNFGGGIYLSNKYFYVGASVPHLVEYDLRDDIATPIWARTFRHYFATLGFAIPLKGDNLIFKPSLLLKSAGVLSQLRKDEAFQNIGAPTEFDVDLSLLFYEQFWVGVSFRSSLEAFTNKTSSYDSADVWISYFMDNGIRIGLAYDYPLNELADVTVGSFEVMLGYEFYYNTKKTVTPRYF